MTSGPPTEYEQLAPHEAARVDAACDGFEQAWKAARADGDVPYIATYLDGWAEPERTILARELVALDRAWRERYGITIQPEEYWERRLSRRLLPILPLAYLAPRPPCARPRTGRAFPAWSWWKSSGPAGWAWSSRPGRRR